MLTEQVKCNKKDKKEKKEPKEVQDKGSNMRGKYSTLNEVKKKK